MYILYMNTTLHVNIDKKTKAAAAKLAEELGLDLSVIVRASLKNFIQTKTFHVEKTYRMTPYLENLIEEINKENKWLGPFNTPQSTARHLKRLIKKK
jgi:addiction module RelB/DinJ family antitoxin